MTTDERVQTLDHVVPLLGVAYTEWKDATKAKDDYKDEFFRLADAEICKQQGLGLKLYEVIADDEATARERAELHNPGWRVDELRPHRVTARLWEVIIQEDPSLKPFPFEHDGVKYARQVSKGPVMVDDRYLAEEDPELYEEATYALPWGERVIVPIQLLDKGVLARMQKYIYNGKSRVSLSVRPIKDES